MGYAFEAESLQERVLELAQAPLQNPEIIPTVLPLVLGAVVLELYFGKHQNEELGWNSSVGNSVVWISTGISLHMTEVIESTRELYSTYFIIGLGLFTGYLNFFHKWKSELAFIASSTTIVYSIAYITTVVIKTDIPADDLTLQAGAAFIVVIEIVFKIIKLFETPANDGQIQF